MIHIVYFVVGAFGYYFIVTLLRGGSPMRSIRNVGVHIGFLAVAWTAFTGLVTLVLLFDTLEASQETLWIALSQNKGNALLLLVHMANVAISAVLTGWFIARNSHPASS